MTRPARRMRQGQELTFSTADGKQLLHATVTGSGEFGERLFRFTPVDDFFARLELLGHVPLPPYIRRGDEPLDRERRGRFPPERAEIPHSRGGAWIAQVPTEVPS